MAKIRVSIREIRRLEGSVGQVERLHMGVAKKTQTFVTGKSYLRKVGKGSDLIVSLFSWKKSVRCYTEREK